MTRPANARSRRSTSGLYRPNGLAFDNGTLYIAELVEDFEGREDRGQSRQSAQAGRYLRRSAQRRGARLEVPRHRSRQQALFQCRRTVQYLHALAGPRAAPPHQSRRQRPGSRSRRDSQLVGMDWHPVLKAALLHRKQPRLAVGGYTGGQAQSAHPARQGQLWISVLSPRQHSGSGIRLGPLVRRIHQAGRASWGRIRPRSACASIRATCSRRNTATPSSSHGTARGTAPRSSAATSLVVSLNENGTVKSVDPFITGFIERQQLPRPPGRCAGP